MSDELSASQKRLIARYPEVNFALRWVRKASEYAITATPDERFIMSRICRCLAKLLREYQDGGAYAPTEGFEILADVHLATVIEVCDDIANALRVLTSSDGIQPAKSFLNADALSALAQVEAYDALLSGSPSSGLDVRRVIERLLGGSLLGL